MGLSNKRSCVQFLANQGDLMEGHPPSKAPVPDYCVFIVLYNILYYVIVSYFIITQGNSRQTKKYLLGNEGNACYYIRIEIITTKKDSQQ